MEFLFLSWRQLNDPSFECVLRNMTIAFVWRPKVHSYPRQTCNNLYKAVRIKKSTILYKGEKGGIFKLQNEAQHPRPDITLAKWE